jgi:hypothetical protein
MLHRRLSQFSIEQRPVWVFLKDQQCWIEEARVVEIDGDLVTLRYQEEDEEERFTWEESVRLDSIGAVRTRLASLNCGSEEISTTSDCPEAERLGR